MSNVLYVVGIGPGNDEYIYPAVRNIIESCDIIIGGKRNLTLFESLKKVQFPIGNNLGEMAKYIQANIGIKRIVVLASGDPGIYSIVEFLKGNLQDIRMEVLPGISSIQYLCSKLQLSWHDLAIASVHGREQDLITIIKRNKKVAVLTGGQHTPQKICCELIKEGIPDLKIAVGENLSYDNENIICGTPQDIIKEEFDSLSLMIIQHEVNQEDSKKLWKYEVPGITDDMYIRGDVPMTKEEVRTVSISKLRLQDQSIVWDVGAGTGSISIECGIICNKGKVVAFEKENNAVEIIKKNIEKFNIDNMSIIQGEAPLTFDGLQKPDRVFIGGSGGNMEEILQWISQNCETVRVVVNAVTIESAFEAIQYMKKYNFNNIDVVQVSISRGRNIGDKTLMQALNPVYVMSCEKGES